MDPEREFRIVSPLYLPTVNLHIRVLTVFFPSFGQFPIPMEKKTYFAIPYLVGEKDHFQWNSDQDGKPGFL